MAIEGSSFELGVISDPRAIRQFLSELEVVPAALKRLSTAINAVDLGDGRKFAGDGKQLAEAFVQAARAELSGGNFQRAFRDAMSGVDLRIPPEAQAHLRTDLERIAAEIRRAVPQQVQIGIRANTSGQSFRDILQTGAPQAFQGEQAQLQRSLAEVREQARQLRAQQQGFRASSAGGSNNGLIGAGGLPPFQVGPTEDITPVRKFVAKQPARDQAAGRLEEQALAEDEKRAKARLDGAQAAGRLETRAQAEDEKRAKARIDAAQSAGKLETRAQTEDEKRTKAQLDAAQRQGRLETQAQREDALRSQLANPNSDTATLQRASLTAQRRRIAAQQAIETDSQFAPGEFERLIEDSLARKLRGAASAESKRGTVFGDIQAGVQGTSGVSFLERQASIISTTASFALGGQVFQGVLNGLSEVVTGTRQFEEALSNLSVTFGDSTGNLRGFATTVGAQANAVGLTQAQGVEAASKSVGLFNTSGLDEQSKQDFAQLAVQVTGRIAQQSGSSDLSGVETNLAGILRSFQLANSDLTRVEDSIAVISKATGTNQADILQAASETATLARAAGFDAFQNTAIIANQATTTGQTAGAAAEQLTQVFAQATNTAVEGKFNQLGINTNSSLADQLGQLGAKVQSGAVSQDELGSISALFGRSRSGAAFRNLIENLPRVNSLADQARNSPGEGQKQFEQVFGNINAEIIKTVGALKNVATELAQSGLLDILGEAVIVVHEVANALTEVLHLFNEIPRPIRSVALQLTELAVALRLFGGTAAASRAFALLGGTTRVGQTVVTRVAGAEAASNVAARFGSTGSAVPGIASLLLNPVTIAAVAAISGIIITSKLGEAAGAAVRAEGTAGAAAATAVSAEDLRGAASARRQAAQAEQGRRDAALGIGNIVDFFNGSDAAKTANRDKALADSLDARAATVEKEQTAAKGATAGLFGRFNSPDEVTAQLQRLQAEGFTAAQRVQALSDAFDNIASTANKAGVAVIHAGAGPLFGQGIAAAVTGALGAGSSQAGLRGQQGIGTSGNFFEDQLATIVNGIVNDPTGIGLFNFSGVDKTSAANAPGFQDLAKKLQGVDTGKLQGDISQHIQDVLKARGVDTGNPNDTVLSQQDIEAVTKAANDDLQKNVLSLIPSDHKFDEIRRIIQDQFKITMNTTLKQFAAGPLTADQAVNFFDATVQEANTTFQADSFRDKAAASATRVKSLSSALDKAKGAIRTEGKDEGSTAGRQDNLRRLADAQNQYDQALADDQKVQLDRTTALIKLRESRRGRLDQSGRLSDELAAAQAAVTAVVDPTDKANAQAAVNNIIAQQQQLAIDTASSVANAKIDPRNNGALAQQAVVNAQNALNDAKAHGDAKAVADATTALSQANVQNLQTQISIANARRSSNVSIGDDVGAATAELANSRNTLKGEIAGTEAYYNTLAQVKQQEKALADARLARVNNLRLLSIDLTNPVAEATAARQAAQDTLRNAKGPDATNKAQIDLRQKQAAEEAAKFQQRLSDVQTADQLGRISHQQYISYLQSEHDRLTDRLRHMKTTDTGYRQALDELNNIDGLLKQAASEFAGQFNIGDIKLPTVYEVRRAIKAGAGGILGNNSSFAGSAAGQVVNDNSQRTLVVQGVSIEEVMRRITALYGGAPVRTPAGRKR